MISTLFLEIVIFSFFFIFGFWLFIVWSLGFISYSSSITSFINTSHVFSLIIFSFSKDWATFNFHKRMQFSNEKRIPNKCIINQKTKTYLQNNLKWNIFLKNTNYSNFPSIYFTIICKCFKKIASIRKKIPFFSIAKEFHHLHKTMGQGIISPLYNERDEPTTTPKGSKWWWWVLGKKRHITTQGTTSLSVARWCWWGSTSPKHKSSNHQCKGATQMNNNWEVWMNT